MRISQDGLKGMPFAAGFVFLAGTLLFAGHEYAFGNDEGATLRILEPLDGAIFSTDGEIPIRISAVSPNDVFLTAEVFADAYPIATAFFCCPLCPCPLPEVGVETILQIPATVEGENPPENPWRGWKTRQAGQYRLIARSIGEHGTIVEAAPVTIIVVDLSLRISVDRDGTVLLSLAQGSLVPGGYDLLMSEDLKSWKRLGPFSPGAIAAFYWHQPEEPLPKSCHYRAVYLPQAGH